MTVKQFKDMLDKFDENLPIEFIERMISVDIEYDFKEVIEDDNTVLVVFKS